MTVNFNPFELEDSRRAHERTKELRSQCPVSEQLPGYYYLAQHADVSNAFLDYEHYSNTDGHRLEGRLPEDERPPWELDPPFHDSVRRLALTALNPRAVAEAEPYIRTVAAELVDRFAGKGDVEIVEELAVPLPSRVIAHMLGFPEEDAGTLRAWVDDDLRGDDFKFTIRPEGEARRAFQAYVNTMIRERRSMQDPPDDIITRMIRFVDDDGRTFTDKEIFALVKALITAGNETTTHLITSLFHELAIRPELYRRLREDRSLVPAALEEALRYDPPVQFILRTCVHAQEVHGTRIDESNRLILGIVSANRDEQVFDRADEFRLDRGKHLGHLTFGRGIHLCVGASVARAEITGALNAALDRIERLELAPGYAYQYGPSPTSIGPARLDLRVTPAVAAV